MVVAPMSCKLMQAAHLAGCRPNETLPAADFQYKFTLGSWSSVEETSSCGYVGNRTFGFDTAGQTYTASDTVAAWEGVGGC